MEHRSHPRARTLKTARIVFNHQRSVIDCMVRNISADGACLQVESPLGIPAAFDVVFDADGSTRPCRMIWRKEKRLGVAFA